MVDDTTAYASVTTEPERSPTKSTAKSPLKHHAMRTPDTVSPDLRTAWRCTPRPAIRQEGSNMGRTAGRPHALA
ncbi:hypothetical protein GCM10012286_61780 [Streptomyces lasiicapitis]|uniref:Transposase n=1 Tax=Streptomyces lasiicapitis TaxID=1923961 RepID=A0ABQ2MK65_9ACTN|nr:hypothetical protein GCM10012286_61780 [Streptomyces lasiicapitis]